MVTAELFPVAEPTASSDPATGPRAALALLDQLRDLGVTLRVDGDLLRASGQTAALTPEFRAAIGEAKPALLALLVRGPVYACVRCGLFSYPTPGITCWWCRRNGHDEAAPGIAGDGIGLAHPPAPAGPTQDHPRGRSHD